MGRTDEPMLIEAAFLNLPPVLTSSFDHADTYEGTLVTAFVSAIKIELNGRNTPNAFEHIYTEKPYPTVEAGHSKWRADLLVKLAGAVPISGRMELYGARELNWLEMKAFFGSTRSRSAQPKTANVGLLVRDVLRLCLLPEELRGRIRQNARYLLVVFANPPADSLAFASNTEGRTWLSNLFREGPANVEIDLSREPTSLRQAIGPGFTDDSSLKLSIRAHTSVFQPVAQEPAPVFWGFLVRINGFELSVPGATVTFEDLPGREWPAASDDALASVRSYVLARMRAQE